MQTFNKYCNIKAWRKIEVVQTIAGTLKNNFVYYVTSEGCKRIAEKASTQLLCTLQGHGRKAENLARCTRQKIRVYIRAKA